MTVDIGGSVILNQRGDWGARPPRSRQSLVPSFGTTVHWEGPALGPFTHDRCAVKVRAIQNFHMDNRGWQDIAYTALICPHGQVYEGRWMNTRTAANGTNAGNSSAYAVCYLGGTGDAFTDEARWATRVLLDVLDTVGGAGPGRNCHRDWKATDCPGDVICSWVRNGQPTAPGTSLPAASPTIPPYPGTVRIGDGRHNGKNGAVRVWQRRFRDIGYGLIIDGEFGPVTNHVVWHFQTTYGLRPDGIAGPVTWHWIWFGV